MTKERGRPFFARVGMGPGQRNANSQMLRYNRNLIIPAPRVPPSYATPVQTVWNTTTTPKTLALSWGAGDVVVVLAMTADQVATVGTPTVSGLTFGPVGTAVTTGSSCWGHKWSATAASPGSGNVSAIRGGTAREWGMLGVVFSGTDGIGANVNPVASTSQVAALTTTQDRSAVVELIGDWGAGVGGVGTVPSPLNWTPTGQDEEVAFGLTGVYNVYGAVWNDLSPAGANNFGVSVTPSGSNYTRIAVEVLGQTATPTQQFEGWGLPL